MSSVLISPAAGSHSAIEPVSSPVGSLQNFPILSVLRDRWSPRAFSAKPVATEDLRALVEAARWAPSAYNEQPWRFLIATRDQQPDAYAKLLRTLVPFNQNWAKEAPVLMLSLAKRTLTRNGKRNQTAEYDTGMAMGNLLAEATARGLSLHGMGGFDAAKARELFGLPEDLEPLAVWAVGYAPEGLKAPERTRLSLNQLLLPNEGGLQFS
jgi:nitroreductase